MTKPTDLAQWGSTLSPGADLTVPGSTEKLGGWQIGKPRRQYMNWWQQAVYRWMVWLDALETTAHTWIAEQTFDDAVFSADPTFPARSRLDAGSGTGGSLGSGWALAAVGMPGSTYRLPGGFVGMVGSVRTTSGSPAGTAFTLATAIRPSDASAGNRLFRIVGERSAAFVPCYLQIIASTGAVLLSREDGGGLSSGDIFFLDGVNWNTQF